MKGSFLVQINPPFLLSSTYPLFPLPLQQNDPTDPTAVALEKCDHYVLKPYRFVLRMVSTQLPY